MEIILLCLPIASFVIIFLWIISGNKKRVFEEKTPIQNAFSFHRKEYNLDNLIGYSFKMCNDVVNTSNKLGGQKTRIYFKWGENTKKPKLILYFENDENEEIPLMNEDNIINLGS